MRLMSCQPSRPASSATLPTLKGVTSTPRFSSSSASTSPKAVLLISGCQDDQLSLDGFSNGLFTETLRTVWNDGAWSGGGYPAFHEAIRSRMPARQQPNYMRVGAQNDEFEHQGPFTVG